MPCIVVVPDNVVDPDTDNESVDIPPFTVTPPSAYIPLYAFRVLSNVVVPDTDNDPDTFNV